MLEFENLWLLKQEGADCIISTSDAAISAPASHSKLPSFMKTLGGFPRPDLEWQSKTDALSAFPDHPKSMTALRSTLSFLRSGGLHAFISSFLPSSKGRKELASSVVGLSDFNQQLSEGQTTPCPLWWHPVFCTDCVQMMTSSWSRFSLWTLDFSAVQHCQCLPGVWLNKSVCVPKRKQWQPFPHNFSRSIPLLRPVYVPESVKLN